MIGRRTAVFLLILLAVSLVGSSVAAKGGLVPLKATWTTASSTGFGVFDDGNNIYEHGVGGVQAYFGVAGKDVDVVTYNTARKLHFKFDANSTAWQGSSLPQDRSEERRVGKECRL